ncbi:MAG TPA: LytTR family DNA-binding domain-containing protein, partial [Ferruginibacter sp.]|nr:LytTR family DNA-binding domain-containing protein [Ferruginibacter sp.]
MKVMIVEPQRHIVKKLKRVLHAIDSSIEILAVVKEAEMLQNRISSGSLPDLVLVNRGLLRDTHKYIEARLIITSGNNHLVYLAFRVINLPFLQKFLLKTTDAAGAGEQLQHSGQGRTVTAISTPVSFLKQELKKRFLVSYQQKLLSIAIEDIAYFFSDNRFIFFKTFDNRRFLVEYRMEELEEILDPQLFFRINRSHIISINSI